MGIIFLKCYKCASNHMMLYFQQYLRLLLIIKFQQSFYSFKTTIYSKIMKCYLLFDWFIAKILV